LLPGTGSWTGSFTENETKNHSKVDLLQPQQRKSGAIGNWLISNWHVAVAFHTTGVKLSLIVNSQSAASAANLKIAA
jgi:hypothetical protein